MSQRINEFNQPIGEEVVHWEKRAFPGEIRYVGDYAIITKLSHVHVEKLYKAYELSARSNWTYLSEEFPASYDEFERMMLSKIEDTTKICYVVLRKETNEPLGIFSLMRIDQQNGVIEVGGVNFSDALKQSTIATEAHYLLAKYVFEELGYRRYEWKCDALNSLSIRAAKRLGFTYEGTFRNAIIYKNRSRDTCWFSMLQEEWPSVKQSFHQWLAKENFDEQGVQIQKLQSFR